MWYLLQEAMAKVTPVVNYARKSVNYSKLLIIKIVCKLRRQTNKTECKITVYVPAMAENA